MSAGRGGRELALHLLYQMEIRSETLDQVLPEALEFFQPTLDDKTFALRLVEYALEQNEKIQELLHSTAKNWDTTRFALLDACVLRIAVSELLRVPESPAKLVINEAIELAKSYSTEKSGGFVNGLLDPIARIVRGDAPLNKGERT
jgi:N utilization substance protein B